MDLGCYIGEERRLVEGQICNAFIFRRIRTLIIKVLLLPHVSFPAMPLLEELFVLSVYLLLFLFFHVIFIIIWTIINKMTILTIVVAIFSWSWFVIFLALELVAFHHPLEASNEECHLIFIKAWAIFIFFTWILFNNIFWPFASSLP